MKWFLASLLLAAALPGVAQERFPEKPVRFIVPFPPGGGTDALARILGAKLGELWGQQVIVENRAGAQGNIGTAAGAKAAPDGYTLTFAHQGALVINPHLYRDPGYDTLKDFAVRGVLERSLASARARAVRKKEPGQAYLRLDLGGAAYRRRAFQADHGHRSRARAVQGRRPRDQRSARRAGAADVLESHLDRAAREERQAARATRRCPTCRRRSSPGCPNLAT